MHSLVNDRPIVCQRNFQIFGTSFSLFQYKAWTQQSLQSCSGFTEGLR